MPQHPDETVRTYYTHHSAITDPHPYAHLFDDLPRDLPSLMEVVQGLLVFPYGAWAEHYGFQVAEERSTELRLRTVPKMLEAILLLDPAPLSIPRPPEKRLYGLCRDFAVLLVSILRHQGVPARERVGFSAYFGSDWYWDHRITEYWDALRSRWVLIDPWVFVDPRLDDIQHSALGSKLDPFNITRDSSYLLGGEAWQLCRAGQADPDIFVDSPTDRGMPMIRYALLHDFDALNKMELVGMDAWHDLIDKPEHELTAADVALLDQIAELTMHVDMRLDAVQELYGQIPYGRAVRERLEMAH